MVLQPGGKSTKSQTWLDFIEFISSSIALIHSLYVGPEKLIEWFLAKVFRPARGIDPGRGEGQRARGSTGLNRASTGGIDPVYI